MAMPPWPTCSCAMVAAGAYEVATASLIDNRFGELVGVP
jgi:hypothetical protein